MFLLRGSVVAVAVLGWSHRAGLHGGGYLALWAKSCRSLSAGPCPQVLMPACKIGPSALNSVCMGVCASGWPSGDSGP